MLCAFAQLFPWPYHGTASSSFLEAQVMFGNVPSTARPLLPLYSCGTLPVHLCHGHTQPCSVLSIFTNWRSLRVDRTH